MHRDFAIAMRLVSLAQQGQAIQLSQLQNVTKLPQFADIPLPVSFSLQMSEQEKYKYDNLFLQADMNKDGFVDGVEAKTYFSKATVPTDKLAVIWSLSEIDKDGKLNKGEFRIAMHLIYWTLKGEALPTSLPESFIQSATTGTIDGSRGRASSAPTTSISTPIQPISTPIQSVSTPMQPLVQTPVQSFPTSQTYVQPQVYPQTQQFGQSTPYVQQQIYVPQANLQPNQVQQPVVQSFNSSRDPFGSFPTSSGDLIFTASPAKHNYDQSKLITQHTLPGATFEQRANFNNELQNAVKKKAQ